MTAPAFTSSASASAQAAAPLRVALLLTDGQGGVLISSGTGPHGTDGGLPGGSLASGETPAAGAARIAQGATGIAALTAGTLLTVDWLSDGSAFCLVHVYDHPPLSASQISALTADVGHRGGLRLVTPGDLHKEVPGEAARILAALHARVDGRTSDLENGRVRAPGFLDLHQVLARSHPQNPGTWIPARRPFDGEMREARGWLVAPDGRVLVHYDPASGQIWLPGGPLLPDDWDDPQAALTRSCAATVMASVGHPELLGFRGEQARFVARLRRLGPLPSQPGEPAVVRLFATPQQALELTGGHTAADELAAALAAARESGFPVPARQPITEAPAAGIADL